MRVQFISENKMCMYRLPTAFYQVTQLKVLVHPVLLLGAEQFPKYRVVK